MKKKSCINGKKRYENKLKIFHFSQENLSWGGAAWFAWNFPAQVVDGGRASVSRVQVAPPAERRRHSSNENGAVRSWSHRPWLAKYQGRLRPPGSNRYARPPTSSPNPPTASATPDRPPPGPRDGPKTSQAASPSVLECRREVRIRR